MLGIALRQWHDARSARRRGPEEMARRQQRRLADLVAYARTHSPLFRERYRDLPDRVDDLSQLPFTTRGELMARFDDWCTDPEVTEARVRSFTVRPDLVGARFLGRYLVTTTSGTTGVPALFVCDDATVSLSGVLGLIARQRCLGRRGYARLLARGGRTAAIVATGGHYMALAGIVRLGRAARQTTFLSVHDPLPQLVAELNRIRPAVLVGYTSVIALLADERVAGRLHIDPLLVEPIGETLTPGDRERIATAFHATVRTPYGSTECTFLATSCPTGWYHVNTDWAVAEPVDADHRPVPPGEPSTTVLLTNLVNRVQPILRYDLGDSVLVRPDPCPCGSPLPALRVQGRVADVLRFAAPGGERVAVPPLSLAALVDRLPGVARFQLVQTTPTALRVRLLPADGADAPAVRATVRHELTTLLCGLGLTSVAVEDDPEPPQQSPGGKYRPVVPLATPNPAAPTVTG